jgi:hypothetical protein
MFEVPFSLNGEWRGLVLLKIDKPIDFMFFGKPWDQSVAMFVDSPHKIVGHAGVERAARLVRENVDPARHRFYDGLPGQARQ